MYIKCQQKMEKNKNSRKISKNNIKCTENMSMVKVRFL